MFIWGAKGNLHGTYLNQGKNSADFVVVVINGILIVRRITSIKFLELLNKQNVLFTWINVGSQKIRERILRIKK